MRRGVRASPWLLGTTARRVRAEWRLLVSVAAVATVACTLITSLGLMVTATEQGGVRGALGDIPASQSVIDVHVLYPTGGIAQLRTNMNAGVADVLSGVGTASPSGVVFSDFIPVEELDEFAIGYVGEYDGIAENTRLVQGSWGSAADHTVALPAAAARDFGLTLGSPIALDDATVTVSGIYEPLDPEDPFWNRDVLNGKGSVPGYINGKVSMYQQMLAFGPLIAADGGMDAAEVPAYVADVAYVPSFETASVDDLAPLIDRLAEADLTIAQNLGNAGARLYVSTEADEAVAAVASGLVVTRSTVIVVSLLLLVLAIAAMAQTARLFTEARAGERQLMRSRGAGQGHVLALAAVEALAIGAVTAGISPLLSLLVYRAFAAQPAMVAAGMPAGTSISLLTIATAGAIAVVLVVVLLLPLARQGRPGVLTRSTRQRRGASILRGGLDVGLALLAAVAFVQLQSYESVVDDSASLGIDPVLVAGPALVLLAGALLSARLVHPASMLVERVGSRSRSVVIALASWDLGRRSQRATSAVLLLALALAVGSFSLSFLATWRQSQVDQASLAVGAVARAEQPIDGGGAVLRTTGRIGGQSSMPGDESGGSTVQVLGLSDTARLLLDDGRVGEEGGTRIASLLHVTSQDPTGATLPAAAKTISVSVTVDRLDGMFAEIRAILERGDGSLLVVSLGSVPADGLTAPLSVELPPGSVRLVGLQTDFTAPGTGSGGGTNEETLLDVLVTDIDVDGSPLDLPAEGWFAAAADRFSNDPRVIAPSGSAQLGLEVVVPANVSERPLGFSVMGWRPVASVPIVLQTDLADDMYTTSGSLLDLTVQGVGIPAVVEGSVDLIPGTASVRELEAASSGIAAGTVTIPTIAADGDLLARALIQAGSTEPIANEWWLGSVPDGAKDVVSAQHVGERLQQAPLRVATQVSLWLAILAGALLAAIGFGVHTASTQRARRIELAQLRAIGLQRSGVLGLVAAESLMLSVLGAVFGVAIGILLAALVGPLVAVSPNGTPPVPAVRVLVPWADIGLLALEVVAVLAVIVLVVARVQRVTQPADLLREGGGD